MNAHMSLDEVRVKLVESWSNSAPLLVEAFLAGTPRLKEDRETFLELVRAELYMREKLDQPAEYHAALRDEFLARFSQFRADLLEEFDYINDMRNAGSLDPPGLRPPSHPREYPALFAGGEEHSTWESIRDFGDFQLLEEIGRGSMGVVYRARQKTLAREIALKMIRSKGPATEVEMRRFRNGAEAAAVLEHPNIVRIYEVGEHGDELYLTMELIAGGPLNDRVEELARDRRTAAVTIATAARALNYAHQHGVIHRDLKPSNILVDADGRIHISEFGLAKKIGSDSTLTLPGAIIGTPSYMAPEQALGDVKRASTAADIYSLGAVFYELLTRRPPFRGDSEIDTLFQVVERPPVPPRSIDPSIDRALETICLKCLEKEPERRYGTAQEVADELDRWLNHEPIHAHPVGRLERLGLWYRRNPIVAGLATAVVALVVAGTIGMAASLLRIQRERETAVMMANWFLQGLTEPLKKIADPDVADRNQFASLRQNVVDEACLAYESYMEKNGPDVSFLIHVALLRTASGEHGRAREAYERAIKLAESQVAERPADPGAWGALGQTHTHLGLEMWVRGQATETEPHFREADKAFRRALALDPRNKWLTQHAAWFLVFCPDPRFRDPTRAVTLARRLDEMVPRVEGNRRHFASGLRTLFTLGLAEFRAGNSNGALKAVTESRNFRDGGDSYERFLLALILAQENGQLAREHFAAADKWMRRNRFGDFELHILRAEAAKALGLPQDARQ